MKTTLKNPKGNRSEINMSEKLKVTLVQTDLIWENPEENRINFSNAIIGILEPVDLVILPEMFTTGFTMDPTHVFETMTGDTISWMQTLATDKRLAICGSIIIKENDRYFNRFLFVHPGGEVETYDKRHTFTLAGEDKSYTSGSKKAIFTYKNWKICPQVCYDLRFPVWSRNTEDYDLLIYVANWPEVRIKAWKTLLKARAIENMSYCIGVNRVGLDGNGHPYNGYSAVYDALGEKILAFKDEQNIKSVTLDKLELHAVRKKLNFLEDRDVFQVMTD